MAGVNVSQTAIVRDIFLGKEHLLRAQRISVHDRGQTIKVLFRTDVSIPGKQASRGTIRDMIRKWSLAVACQYSDGEREEWFRRGHEIAHELNSHFDCPADSDVVDQVAEAETSWAWGHITYLRGTAT